MPKLSSIYILARKSTEIPYQAVPLTQMFLKRGLCSL